MLKYKSLIWDEPLIGLQLGAFINNPNIHLAIILGKKGPKFRRVLDDETENKYRFFSKESQVKGV